jgi:hypothetical protein
MSRESGSISQSMGKNWLKANQRSGSWCTLPVPSWVISERMPLFTRGWSRLQSMRTA